MQGQIVTQCPPHITSSLLVANLKGNNFGFTLYASSFIFITFTFVTLWRWGGGGGGTKPGLERVISVVSYYVKILLAAEDSNPILLHSRQT